MTDRNQRTGCRPGSMTRREVLRTLAAAVGTLSLPGVAHSYGQTTYFTWAQLRYRGSWDPNPRGHERLLEVLRRRTSVEAAPRRRVIEVGNADIFSLPFLYIAGRGDFPDLGPEGEAWLRRYLEHGGFVLWDDATGIPDSGFAQAVGETARRLVPGRALRPLPAEHTVFQSFYLLRDVPGRKLVRPFLYGVDIEDLTPFLLCVNDLGGAWDGDPVGGYTHPCVPGGERQREMSFRMGVNLVLYALTGNYKKDQVHIPFILKRRQR